MVKIIGVSFKDVGKIYWFNPNGLTLSVNDKVVVETIRGIELGTVVLPEKELDESSIEHELKPVIRLATKQDLNTYEKIMSGRKSACPMQGNR